MTGLYFWKDFSLRGLPITRSVQCCPLSFCTHINLFWIPTLKTPRTPLRLLLYPVASFPCTSSASPSSFQLFQCSCVIKSPDTDVTDDRIYCHHNTEECHNIISSQHIPRFSACPRGMEVKPKSCSFLLMSPSRHQ